jgi:hypothetical protein
MSLLFIPESDLRFGIQNKLNAAESLVIAITGDSMANSLMLPFARALNTRRFGITGYALRALTWTLGGSATESHTAQSTFISGSIATLTTASDSVAFSSPMGGAGVVANKIRVFYVTASGGGTFKVQTKASGGAWADEAGYTAVSTDAASAGNVITITKASAVPYQVRCVHVSGGNVVIIGAALEDTSRTGITLVGLNGNGTDLPSGATSAPTAISNPVLASLDIDVHLVSTRDLTVATAPVQAVIDYHAAAVSRAQEWVWLGGPPVTDNSSNTIDIATNAIYSTLATSRGEAYFDSRSRLFPNGQTDWSSTWWTSDGTHLSVNGAAAYTEDFLRWIRWEDYMPEVNDGIGFSSYMAANQTLGTGAATTCTFDTVDKNTALLFDTAAYCFTAPLTGFYTINAQVIISGHTGGAAELALYDPVAVSKTKSLFYRDASENTLHTWSGTVTLWMRAGSKIDVRAYQQSGGNKTLYGYQAYTHFSASLTGY